MEEWVGVPLKSTACYGVRLYYRGSVLANHVDRIDTHVVSAIINVAQVCFVRSEEVIAPPHVCAAHNTACPPSPLFFVFTLTRCGGK